MLRRALAHHQQGQLNQAEFLYRRVLQHVPDQFDARHLLGVVDLQRQNFAGAAELIGQALRLNPSDASAHSNLGAALRGLGRADEALASYDRALKLKPDYAEALNNRANLLRDLGQPAEALAGYDRALAVRPDYAEALVGRGDVLLGLGRPEAALTCYDRALAIKPDNAETLNSRGTALQAIGRYDAALASFDRALAIRPDAIGGLINRGNVLVALHRPDQAIANYDRALALAPDYAEAWNNRGGTLLGLRRAAEALANFDRALAIRPDFPDALGNRGAALRDLRQPEAALASFDRALAIAPGHADALNNRGDLLRDLRRHEAAADDFTRLLSIRPNREYVAGELFHVRNHCCDWADYNSQIDRIVSGIHENKRVITPFSFVTMSDCAKNQLQCANIYAGDKCSNSNKLICNEINYHHDKIRVAYLSADFYEHATIHLMMGLFEAHDKSRFETTAISFGPSATDELRIRLENAFTNFIDVHGKSDHEVAALLREMEIDIAIDLKGHTGGARPRILSFRPAPVQVNYLGYPGTMGCDHIDYIIADPFLIPENQHSFYVEKVVYLPDTYQPTDSRRRIDDDTMTRQEAGLPERGFVFCSFNNSYKITPTVFEIWLRLLDQVEGSALWLLGDNPAAIHNLRRNAELRGIAPGRLVFASRVKPSAHLARHRLADLMLDTLPYNAHTTASDALWAGLPLVTCPGGGFAARVAGSLLHAVGLPELIAETLEDYEALALGLARDPGRLAALKAKLQRERETCPLFDTERYRRHIESAYETMWQRYQRGDRPASFAVDPIR